MEFHIPKDKEEIIYKAAITEFAKEGYKNASTNNIVKESNISKGSLFKYFGNKKNLYIYVVRRSLKVLEDELLEAMVELSDDMFERIIQTQTIKIEMCYKYELESKIIMECFTKEEDEFREELKEQYSYYEKLAMELITKGIDYTKFKDGIDVKQVYSTLLYISYGYKEKLNMTYKDDIYLMMNDIDEIKKELQVSIDLIKNSVYK